MRKQQQGRSSPLGIAGEVPLHLCPSVLAWTALSPQQAMLQGQKQSVCTNAVSSVQLEGTDILSCRGLPVAVGIPAEVGSADEHARQVLGRIPEFGGVLDYMQSTTHLCQ